LTVTVQDLYTKKHSKAIATSKQSYKYLLVGFAGFSESFLDVAQNITVSHIRGWIGARIWRRCVVGSGYPSDTMGQVAVPKKLSHGL